MPRFPIAAWMCLAGVLTLASTASAQTDASDQVETTGFRDALGPNRYVPANHPLVAPAKPVPLPVTLDVGLPNDEEPTSATADPSSASADPTLGPPLAPEDYQYVDENEGTFSRLMRFYRHLTAKKYCFCENFVRGQWTASFMTGYLQTPLNWFGIRVGPGGPRLDFLPLNVRLGRIIRGNDGERRIKGSTEVILELTNMPIVNGSGNFLIGGTAILRHNFSYTRRRFIPYIQAGGGAAYSDSWTGGAGATNLVSGFNFIIHSGWGSRFFINPRWSLDTESAFYHFSNSGIAAPNVGVNGIAGMVGLTYYFNRR